MPDFDADMDPNKNPDGTDANPDETLQPVSAEAASERIPWRQWLAGPRGKIVLGALLLIQALGWMMLHRLGSAERVEKPVERATAPLSLDRPDYRHEVNDVFVQVSAPGGRRLTLAVWTTLVLGLTPDESLVGAETPNDKEMQAFLAAVELMEPMVRDLTIRTILEARYEDLWQARFQDYLGQTIQDAVNDRLERLDFGDGVRTRFSRRRVTRVLFPRFVQDLD